MQFTKLARLNALREVKFISAKSTNSMKLQTAIPLVTSYRYSSQYEGNDMYRAMFVKHDLMNIPRLRMPNLVAKLWNTLYMNIRLKEMDPSFKLDEFYEGGEQARKKI